MTWNDDKHNLILRQLARKNLSPDQIREHFEAAPFNMSLNRNFISRKARQIGVTLIRARSAHAGTSRLSLASKEEERKFLEEIE